MKVYAENKRARFDYEILETFEAGIELIGTEVKSIRSGRVNLAGAFAVPLEGGISLINVDIPPFQPKNTPEEYNAERSRRLLLSKKEIAYLIGKAKAERLTIIPIKLYSKGPYIKLELALTRSKKKADKRETIKKREVKREIARKLKI
ncbi:MAG: SsrA-binding protein [Candidatus Harrisonbacteria bacterium CG10_big_fil_rev_8_21_14_0_10_42_17]|uniref:SsrA-binding protein n=1 Tax=Candidatus Harrisonbacteria bacterium CG10_big_fil_rev_8_21_14_0_10_42_17 TaxID=1974584 RepID=A0A2M6WJ90_9BACT|nr:MAG: SsrA-binding protein [Candidatus Harrisonbacteria bacterium CG10_big_fil_rev_8_21_14_0_10_42_17]